MSADLTKSHEIKNGLSLSGAVSFFEGLVDPTAGSGIVANIGSIYVRYGSGVNTIHQKIDTGDTAWITIGNIPNGANNVGIGYQVGNSLAAGAENVFIGYQAGYKTATASYSVYIGSLAGTNVDGADNIAIGYHALIGNGTGAQTAKRNIALGNTTLNNATSAQDNISIGYGSGFAISSGQNNTILGTQAGANVATGSGNVFIGYQAGNGETGSSKLYIANTSTVNPLIYGDFTGGYITINALGTAKADHIFLNITNLVNNADMDGTSSSIQFNQFYYDVTTPAVADAAKITVGTEQDWTSTGSTQNSYMSFLTAFEGAVAEKVRITSGGDLDLVAHKQKLLIHGTNALYIPTATTILIGEDAGSGWTNETNNVYIGYQAGYNIATANNSVGIGTEALKGAGSSTYTGDNNVGIGYQVGMALTTGNANVFIGYVAGTAISSGASNIFIGYASGFTASTQSYQTFVGSGSGYYSAANYNTGFGYQALQGAATGFTGANNSGFGVGVGIALTNGANNVLLGFQAGAGLTSGTGNVFVGYQAGSAETTNSNKLYIANSNTVTPLILGDFGTPLLSIYGDLEVRTAKELRFYNAANTFYVGFKGGASAANKIWTLPLVDGNKFDVLATDGSGVLSWASGGIDEILMLAGI